MKEKLQIGPLDHRFTAPIGVEVKGEMWSCVEMPDSAELFETKKAVRVNASVDGIKCPSVGLMVTGKGGICFRSARSSANNLARISATKSPSIWSVT